MYYMIDNYDSFVYNLAAYLEEAGQKVLVRKAKHVTLSEIYQCSPQGIIISPGPKTPAEAVKSQLVLKEFQNRIPILGVCLGHQIIGHYYGAQIKKGESPMHGKVTEITHNGNPLFEGLPKCFAVTRYHSLVIAEEKFPKELEVTARACDGAIMGIAHKCKPVFGVQFHPEAVLTEYGHELLKNFHELCENWRERYAEDKRA
ncbi:MAG: aminodeoxychorismate/anthranilate synthase component II [Lachnospiraceae bacterium]|jgi:anthranilate synthase/aminodeoxychorismate synthase-like glutamine amidotransferase|nr:aminodeoxychorismate/anthranilate synthase component II [Lachnospiraceae bacterium]MDD3616556.1 aminodeoxychorismate/anthranilate synthase component II [Lachnospiraceae bacterium]